MNIKQPEWGDLIRQMRHEYGNLLQVASSYLDLGLVDETKNYLQQEILKWHKEQVMLRALPNSLLPYLFYQRLKCKKQGIDLQYQSVNISSVEVLDRRQEPFTSAVALLHAQGGASDPVLYLSLREQPEGIELYFEGAGISPKRVLCGKE